jgi:glycosyltransferase involved in cell wall biosynthesis
MTKKYEVTVLICVHSTNYNYDFLLMKSLKSLENQTYKNFKTLLVLDECWGNTKKIITQTNFDLDIEIQEKNKKNGLGDAKNFGLSLIDTEWVGFLDGDDLYLPKKLETQINYIKNNYVDFLGTHRQHIDAYDDTKLHKNDFDFHHYITHSEIKNKLPIENILTHGSMLIRKKCLDDLGGYNNIRGFEDWDLWKRAMEKGYEFYQIPERLYLYRTNTSISR